MATYPRRRRISASTVHVRHLPPAIAAGHVRAIPSKTPNTCSLYCFGRPCLFPRVFPKLVNAGMGGRADRHYVGATANKHHREDRRKARGPDNRRQISRLYAMYCSIGAGCEGFIEPVRLDTTPSPPFLFYFLFFIFSFGKPFPGLSVLALWTRRPPAQRLRSDLFLVGEPEGWYVPSACLIRYSRRGPSLVGKKRHLCSSMPALSLAVLLCRAVLCCADIAVFFSLSFRVAPQRRRATKSSLVLLEIGRAHV